MVKGVVVRVPFFRTLSKPAISRMVGFPRSANLAKVAFGTVSFAIFQVREGLRFRKATIFRTGLEPTLAKGQVVHSCQRTRHIWVLQIQH